jgi:hypothetical protein
LTLARESAKLIAHRTPESTGAKMTSMWKRGLRRQGLGIAIAHACLSVEPHGIRVWREHERCDPGSPTMT